MLREKEYSMMVWGRYGWFMEGWGEVWGEGEAERLGDMGGRGGVRKDVNRFSVTYPYPSFAQSRRGR